jgi:hypothetical protein
LAKSSQIGKNTVGVNKRTETDFKEISGDIWQKVVKMGKNTEGVNIATETDFKRNVGRFLAKSSQNGQKY